MKCVLNRFTVLINFYTLQCITRGFRATHSNNVITHTIIFQSNLSVSFNVVDPTVHNKVDQLFLLKCKEAIDSLHNSMIMTPSVLLQTP